MAGYVVLLLGVSWTSQEKTLAMNQPKEFRGFYLDCHLRAAVVGVRRAKRIGSETAQNEFVIVRVRVSNDAKRAALNLTEPIAELYDEGPRIYSRRLAAERELGASAAPDLNQSVAAGASFEKEIVFDVTEPAQDLRLLLTEGTVADKILEAFLIGDEDSLFHARTFLRVKNKSEAIKMLD